MNKPKIAVFTGAGISAESGLATFRASDGLWENHRIEDVASPEGWERNPGLVLDFYNQRRIQAAKAQPNAGHLGIAELENWFDVSVITQNVDNLHERAGSTNILHLHGSLFHARGTGRNQDVLLWEKELMNIGDLAEDGSQLRPHIVWFGEAVPMIEPAIAEVSKSEALVVVGTSLQVYPAASLLSYLPYGRPILYLDPNPAATSGRVEVFAENASSGIGRVSDRLLEILGVQP